MRPSRLALSSVFAFAAVLFATPQTAAPAGQANGTERTSRAKKAKSAPATAVDLNSASEAQLESVPGIGRATAKKIADHRPYSSVDDLSKAGISKNEIGRIRGMVTVNGDAAAASAPPVQPQQPGQTGSSNRSAASPTNPNPPPPGSGMVWVNTETKVYHREGDRWYGKTKHGSYMSESDAIKAGYRAAK